MRTVAILSGDEVLAACEEWVCEKHGQRVKDGRFLRTGAGALTSEVEITVMGDRGTASEVAPVEECEPTRFEWALARFEEAVGERVAFARERYEGAEREKGKLEYLTENRDEAREAVVELYRKAVRGE